MSSSFGKKYLEALKTFDDWVIVSEWAQKVGDLYPDILAKAESEAENQANDTTGMREIAARIGSIISQGGYENKIEIDTSERPRKVRYIPEEIRQEHDALEIEEDIAPLRRSERIKQDVQDWSLKDKYRHDEFEAISKQLKNFLGMDFEVDHATALLNNESPGKHHPNNFQLLLKAHNSKKSNNNWERFTFEEQKEYLATAIKLQALVAKKLNVDMDESVIDSLLDRLSKVYNLD